MTIRAAAEDDIDAICRVAQRAWETDYPDILTRETVEKGVDVWYAPEQIGKEFERDGTVLLVAERGETVVGFAHAAPSETGEAGNILRLYVHPDYRRENIGRELLERTCTELAEQGAERIYGMVLTENDPGNAFYTRFGFEAVDERETTIGNESYPETRYVLEQPFTLNPD